VALVADALESCVGAEAERLVEHELDGVDLRVVDRDGADRLGQLEAVGLVVDHEDPGRALDAAAQRGQEAGWARAVGHDGVVGLDLGELRAVPAGREDVGEHDVVVLLLDRVLTETQGVEVAEGDAQELRLTALVGAHVREACHAPRAEAGWALGPDFPAP
jgi:hypothetical protein